jgi:nicotinate phosphoribosyltransferase
MNEGLTRKPVSLWPDPNALGAMTDLYQLTMMAGYDAAGLNDAHATFELFVRRLPPGRAYLVFAGLEQAIGDLLRLRFNADHVRFLRGLPAFAHIERGWFDRLLGLRFEGDLWSVAEGTIVFAGEPLIRVVAPLPQAQWVETFLIASIAYPTLVASKAARMVHAARGRPLYDFGARRGHGPHSGMLAARASFVAGFAGTSHMEAAHRLGIPCVGTMAHSWVQSFPSEVDAFDAFAHSFPESSTLLVDTYSTEDGVRHAAIIEPPAQAVRLDSGDLSALARKARAILDERGRRQMKILASGDLNEFLIDDLVRSEAPIDAFGVGTELVTSRDAPALAMVYKLVELNGAGRLKLSAGKTTYPLAKQVYRAWDTSGEFKADHVTCADEQGEGEPLLQRYVEGGQLAASLPSLRAIQSRCRDQLANLPEELKGLDAAPSFPVTYSERLDHEAARLRDRVESTEAQ